MPGKYDHIDFVPPKSVAEEATKGLKYREMAGGKGGLSPQQANEEGVGSGVQRAVNLKNRDKLSPKTIRRMRSFFSRHKKNKAIDPKHKNEPWKDRGYVAWLIWGGDSGEVWANKVGDQLDKADGKIAVADYLRRLAGVISLEKAKGFVTDIEKDTVENTNFRKVLYTGKHSQLVLMSLKPGEDIGEEVHEDTDQFFRIDKGSGKVIINGNESKISDGSAIVIPAGAKHNVINDGKELLAIYSIYSPPHHADKTIHKTKEEALASKEHFDGKTTEK